MNTGEIETEIALHDQALLLVICVFLFRVILEIHLPIKHICQALEPNVLSRFSCPDDYKIQEISQTDSSVVCCR